MLGRAIDIGTQIEHGGAATLEIGHATGDGGTLNAVHGFEHIACDGHQSARVASRYRSLCGTRLDLLDGHAHGRVFFASHGDFDRVVHADHLRGGDNLRARMVERRQRVRQANEQELRVGVGV